MQRPPHWTRRDLLQAAALALPALPALPAMTALQRLAQPAAAAAQELSASSSSSSSPSPSPSLPPPPPVPGASPARGPLQVIVVGAGMAGLAAAYELVALGHAVTVLEAQDRPGGRVYTLRQPFADGLYAEAGAIGFSESYRHMMRYLKLFNLPSGPPAHEPLATVYHLRGRRLASRPGPGARRPDWPFQLTAEEQGLGLDGMFQKYFAVADKIGDPAAPGWRLEAWKSYDQMTLAELLRRQGASGEAVELLGDTVWFGYGWSQVSALHRLLSDVALFYLGQSSKVIPGGSDLLPKAFAATLGGRIQYRSPVARIVHETGGVRVVFQQGGAERSLTADRLICTVPCPALRKIVFGPELPARQRQIVEQLDYNPVTRIYLQARRRFWTDAGEAGNAFTDLPIQLVTEHPLTRPAGQGKAAARGILECHVKGPGALRIAALDQAAQLALAVDNMEKVHPGFKSHYESGAVVAWGADPWAGGGYAWWRPGQLTEWVPELARPVGRVHFAGEHTSLLARTLEGALESGNRAAREVHAAPRPLSPLAGAMPAAGGRRPTEGLWS
jgi:monoamine oxidase